MGFDLPDLRADISKLDATDLRLIQNEVLAAIAGRLIRKDPSVAHDSHSSSHSKNSLVDFGPGHDVSQIRLGK